MGCDSKHRHLQECKWCDREEISWAAAESLYQEKTKLEQGHEESRGVIYKETMKRKRHKQKNATGEKLEQKAIQPMRKKRGVRVREREAKRAKRTRVG